MSAAWKWPGSSVIRPTSGTPCAGFWSAAAARPIAATASTHQTSHLLRGDDETQSLLAVEAGNEHRLAEYVAVHRVDHFIACRRRFLRSGGHRHVDLRVERVQLEGVVMVRSGPGAGAHVAGRAQARLARAVRL